MNLLSMPTVQSKPNPKRAKLEERLRRAAVEPEAVPLSFAQQRLWVLDQLEPGSSLYNIPVAVEFTGKLDRTALQQALNGLVARHEVLRTRFGCTEECPLQVVEENAQAQITWHDLAMVTESLRENEARRQLQADATRPFALGSAPLLRATLFRLDEEKHWFLLNLHHSVADEWSLNICFHELAALYEAFRSGKTPELLALPIQYADYAIWQREWLQGEVLEKQIAYWRKQLRGKPPVFELPSDRLCPATPRFRGNSQSRPIPGAIGNALMKLAEQKGTSLFMLLLAAFKVMLHRYTQQTDILVGSPSAGRNRIETEGLIGLFVNTLILRTDLSGDPTFEDLLQRVRETTLGAYAHQDLPFEKIVEDLRPERTLNHNPFTHVMFAVERNRLEELCWPGLKLRFLEVATETAKFDLTFVVQETDGRLVARVEFNRDLFNSDSMARLLENFETLLGSLVASPQRRLSELSLLGEAERRKILSTWNATATDFPKDQTIPQLFEAQAQRTPNALAVAYGDSTLTFRELDGRANQLARHLQALSVGPGVPVGLCLTRSPELIIAMLAVLKAGGAYVPLDSDYPKARLAQMLTDSKSAVLITQENLVNHLPTTPVHILCLDSDCESIARERRDPLVAKLTPESPAYIIYTSGSTGRPKGVVVPHRAVVRLVLNTNYARFTCNDRIAQASNTSFDAATFEIWGALLTGAKLIGISTDVALSPQDFSRELRERQISVLFLTTALFNQIAALRPDAFMSVRVVMFGGEAVDPKWVRAVLKYPPTQLLHVYGPTENTTFSTWHEIKEVSDDAKTIPIGRPIANSQCYILDAHLNPVPIGVSGELHLAGDGLALGYWNQPDLSREQFIPNPYRDGNSTELLYKTGDLTRWLPDGSIEFIGRKDQQIKIRGFRIEPGEIESALAQYPGVRDCVVTAHENGSGDRKLAAYFVPNGKCAAGSPELRQFLKEKLPDYMVPSAFVRLDALPLTPNGKVDRRALPEPGPGRPEMEKRYATPQDKIELELTRIWENELGIHPIGIEDKFFELGGHSLLAIRVIGQIEKVLGRKLKLATIFQAQTIKQLAAIVREEIPECSAISGTSLVEIQPKGSREPLFLVHGAGGGMFWGYVNLSQYLGPDQPVYGIRSCAMGGGKEFESVEELAAHYLADLRSVQPKGPYHVGGYCFGGNVAYEMARQLRQQGHEVATVALFNCAPANSRYARISGSPRWVFRFLINLYYWGKYFLNWTPPQRRGFFRWKKEMLKRRADRFLGQTRKSKATVDAGELVDLSSYSEEQRQLWESHIRSLINYHPQPYSGRVHLFRSPGHPLLCSFDADYGWGDLAQGGVQITIVPGVHEKLLEEPSVQSLAVALKQVLTVAPKCAFAVPADPLNVSHDHGRAITSRSLPRDKELAQRAFWRSRLEGAPELLDLPADRPRPAQQSDAGARIPIALSKQISDALIDLSHSENCTPFVTLLGVFKTLLSRYTGTTDILVGSTTANCNVPELDRVERTFDNVVVLRSDLSGNPTFVELLSRLRETVQSALANGDLPLGKLLEELHLPRNTSYNPLFQVCFTYDEESLMGKSISGGRFVPFAIHNETSQLDLTLYLAQSPEGFSGWIEYSPALFDAERITRLVEHFGTLLQAVVENPDQHLSLLPLLSRTEANQILIEWNATQKPYATTTTLAALFEEQVRRSPDALALISGSDRLSYGELNERANQLAHHLREFGVRPGVLTGICLERSWRLLVAILGVLKAGGAYVPLDPTYPKDRLAFILRDTNASVLLTEQALRGLNPNAGTPVFCLDTDWPEICSRSRENLFTGTESGDLAYIIYTSGSTGQPKGVAIEHRSVVALVSWAKDVFAAEELSGVLASTSVCFDLSIFEMFVPLSSGGTVILVENALALADLPVANLVTLINTVPSAMRELLRVKGVPTSVQVVNLAGEPLATSLVDQIYAETKAKKVYDLYGPSETTTYSTFKLRQPREPATIGCPLANEQVYLLDNNREPVPIGIPGELYIGGDKLARCYLNRQELTAEKFVRNPFKPGTRLYRTGDLARWRADGNLEFLGRIDNQVKIRGFRIELGEIESTFRKHPEVREVIVLARENESGTKRLVAYVVTKSGQPIITETLRQFAKEHLPEYMVPGVFVYLEALPLTPNGKVNRKALPEPQQERDRSAADYVAPRTPVETQLAAIWCDVLRINRVGLGDNFFELGGDSLLAIQVISRVRENCQVDLPLFSLFDAPTIELLAKGLHSKAWTQSQLPVPPLEPVPRNMTLPVAFVQERLWFLDQLEPGNYAYNVPIGLRLKGPLNISALQQSIDKIASRHEALRTTFVYANGNLTQTIASSQLLPIQVTDFQSLPPDTREPAMQSWLKTESRRTFDLASGPLTRVHLARLGEADYALLLVMHHAISDGWSITLFFQELETFYRAFASRQPTPHLPGLRLQYADYAVWKRNCLQGCVLEQELQFWKTQLKGAPNSLLLPVDHTEPAQPTRRAQRASLTCSKDTAKAVVQLSQQHNTTPFGLLAAVLAIVLERWTHQRDIVIGTVVAGRNRYELEHVIGCFMNFLPIRMQPTGNQTGSEFLAKVKTAVVEAQEHQDCPFEKIVESVNPARRRNQNPLYNVAFLLQNFPSEMFKSEHLKVSPLPVDLEAALLDLRFEAEWVNNELILVCEYKVDLFAAETIQLLLASYQKILEALIRNPERKLSEFQIIAELAVQARDARGRKAEQTLAIAATFTAEPIEESLRYWAKEVDWSVTVEFAPYNQIFQQLLDPTSLLATNSRGLNVLLVRTEDWLKTEAANRSDSEGLIRVAQEFVGALQTAANRTTTPFLVFLCPASNATLFDPERKHVVELAETFIAAEAGTLGGVHVVTSCDLLRLYSVPDYYDPIGDELGRIPYVPVFFTALGTMVVRKWDTLKRTPHKVIVLDCDQTLWSGVCGEDGAKGISLDASRQALQEFMRAQHAVGRILAVCSKNNEQDVREVFDQRTEMPLRHEHFGAWRTNWLPKSENLKSIAQELNVGLDSFIFVDDNPIECAEVEAHCPEVLTLQLPEDPAQIPHFLNQCWVFDYAKVTAEDRKRGTLYRENQKREQLRKESSGLSDFIASLNLKIEIEPIHPAQFERVAQLTHRTNQFNCTTIRRTETEVQALAATSEILTVSVRDRFGDYGLVGVVVCSPQNKMLDVETLLLSCRVLGRGVEHALLAKLGEIALARKLDWVDVHYHHSEKNKPALDFLEHVGAPFRQALNGGSIYRFPATVAAELHFNPQKLCGSKENEVQASEIAEMPATERRYSLRACEKHAHVSFDSRNTETAIPEHHHPKLEHSFRRYRAIALESDHPAKIHKAIEAKAPVRSAAPSGYAPPETDMERQLCAIWQKILRIERVGLHENFFELGGHSLLAVRLFAELETLTKRKFPLVTVFQAPTVQQLARVLDDCNTTASLSPLVPVQPNGSRPPLFLAHGAGGDVLWGYANLAKHLPDDQPLYGIKSRGQIGLEEYDRIDEMARYYVEEIRAFQPHGPYHLGGYCLGGNVAYEMARQLRADGEEVALVALIDAFPANAGYERVTWWRPYFPLRFARNAWYWIEDFREQTRQERRRFVARKIRIYSRKLLSKFRHHDGDEKLDLEEVIDPAYFPEHELKFWEIHLRALINHVEQPYDGSVTLIRTRGQPLLCSFAEDFCWGTLAKGGVTVRQIPGSHENIFNEPNVGFLAEQLKTSLAAAHGPTINGTTKA